MTVPELWPFRPVLPFTEKLTWLTDVLPSFTGEQRIALRAAPRQSFETNYRLETNRKFNRAKFFARMQGGEEVLFPVWLEQVRVADVGAADTVIALDTTAGDFRAGGYLVAWQDDETYAVAEILAVSDADVTLTATVGVDLATPLVMPARRALALEGYAVERAATYTDLAVKFLVVDNVDLAPPMSPPELPEYLVANVVTDPPAKTSNITEDVVRAAEYVDNGFGPVVVEPVRNYVDFGQTVSFVDLPGAELWERRAWLHSLRGKQRPFWLPSFNNDFVAVSPIGAASLTIEVESFGLLVDSIGRHVMIETWAGARYFREITNVSVGVGTDTLTIDSALGAALAVADIRLFCFLSLVRLNSDEVSIEVKSHNFVTTVVSVVEVPA